MKTPKNRFMQHKTIEEQLAIIPNKYELTRVVSLRVRELMGGSPPSNLVDPILVHEYRHTSIPGSRCIKVALDEISKKTITISRPEKDARGNVKAISPNDDIFTAF